MILTGRFRIAAADVTRHTIRYIRCTALEHLGASAPSPFTKWEGSPASGDSGIMLDEARPAKHESAVDSAAYAEVTFLSRQGGESQSFR